VENKQASLLLVSLSKALTLVRFPMQ